MSSSAIDRVAGQLCQWFDQTTRVVDDSLFSIAPPGPHRQAAIVNVLMAKARAILDSKIDKKGALYTPLVLALAAARRHLGVSLTPAHWLSALENIISLREKLLEIQGQSGIHGIEIGTPATIFKEILDQALLNSGLAGVPSTLDPENRQLALGLALNWGIRFLLAYAAECDLPAGRPEQRDLAWVSALIRELL